MQRGLSGVAVAARAGGLSMSQAMQVVMLPVAAILPDPTQLRKKFDEEAEIGLAQSMDSVGQLHPIRVWKIGDNYQIEEGERRWRAAQRNGWKEIPAIIVGEGQPGPGARHRQFVANHQHEKMTSYETTMSIHTNVMEHGWNGVEAARHLGMKAPLVSKHLTIAIGPPWVLEKYREGLINFSQAYEICADPSAQKQRELLAAALNGASRDDLVRGKKRGDGEKNGQAKPARNVRLKLPGGRTVTLEKPRDMGDALAMLDDLRAALKKLDTQGVDLGEAARRMRGKSGG
jgi:ParB/RepB/Spo0J family partition protein